ncbi:MAG: insulinase family protein [Deltaproteobacteria bacterium]|nr:insulinase family protein [Deltaproteobacteria bacterium]
MILFSILLFCSCQREKIIQDEHGIIKTRLKNGLTIILKETHTSPLVSILTDIHVGFGQEQDHQLGVAHLLERMLLKGTPKRPAPEDISIEVRTLGGEIQSWTSYDKTQFLLTLPSRTMEQGLDLVSDFLIHSKLDPTELSKESEIAIQEIKQNKDNPLWMTHTFFKRLALPKHPLSRNPFGTEEILRKLTRNDLLLFFRQHYTAKNITLTVVGDFNARETLKAIRKTYELFSQDEPPQERPSQSRTKTSSETPSEDETQEFRYKRFKQDLRHAYVELGFSLPPLSFEEKEILETIGLFLGFSLETTPEGGFFSIQKKEMGKNIFETEVSLLSQIERFKQGALSTEETEALQNSLETHAFINQEKTELLAKTLSAVPMAQAPELKTLSMTSQGLQRVAQKYFDWSRLSIVEYLSYDDSAHPYSKDELLKNLQAHIKRPAALENTTSLTKSLFPPFLDLKTSSSEVTLKRYQLSNNAILLLKESHTSPLVTLTLLFRGGRLNETKNTSGLTRLLLETSVRSTTTRTETMITKGFERLGAHLELICEPDFFGYSLTLLSKHVDEGLKILSDIILHPAFSEENIQKAKESLFQESLQREDDAPSYTYELFKEAAFKNHPYGLPESGLKNALLRITPDKLIQWHASHMNSTDMVISIVGDFNTLDMRTSMENYFKIVKPKTIESAEIEDIRLPSFISENFKERNRERSALLIGFETTPQSEPDTYALKVLESLTSGPGSRFSQKLKTEEKLTSSIATQSYAYLKGGVFTAFTTVAPEDEKKTLRTLLEEFKKLKDEPVQKKELSMAQNSLIGGLTASLQTTHFQSRLYAENEIYEKPPQAVQTWIDHVGGLSPTDINLAAIKYFNLDSYTLGIIRGTNKIQPIISVPAKPVNIPKPKLQKPKIKPKTKPLPPAHELTPVPTPTPPPEEKL